MKTMKYLRKTYLALSLKKKVVLKLLTLEVNN